MKRLGPLDRALLLTLVPLWLVCFGLHVKEVHLTGMAQVPLNVYPAWSADDYPTVARVFLPDYQDLQPGDRLIRAADEDLGGVGVAGFFARAHELDRDLSLSLLVERAGERRQVELPLYPMPFPWSRAPTALCMVLMAAVMFVRAPTRQTRALFLAAIFYSLVLAPFFGGPRAQNYLFSVVYFFAVSLSTPLILHALLIFPQEVAATGRFARTLPWVFGGFAALLYSWGNYPIWITPSQATAAGIVLTAASYLTVLGVLTRNYRHSGPSGRRQLRWVVLSFYLAAVAGLALLAGSVIHPAPWWRDARQLLALTSLLIPLGFFAAHRRYNLFDVDRLISATAAYSAVGVLLVAGMVAASPLLSSWISPRLGLDPTVGQLMLAASLVAILLPLQSRLRPRLERILFAERVAVDEGFAALLRELETCVDSRELTTRAGERIEALLRPDSCVVYAQDRESFAPVFVHGRAVPPAFEQGSTLIQALGARPVPRVAEGWGEGRALGELGPFDRAALETLGAAVIVPIRRAGDLVAFLCLGSKRSGDSYTSTDLTLLEAVAGRISSLLARQSGEAMIREARQMQEELRRFVPGAVKRSLREGHDLEPGERSVSVLFVDIRSYASFAEQRSARDVFSSLNQYTRTVSSIVEKHGGSVVEFNGDGMMAVFGAPQVLTDKERAALLAGREMIAAVRSIADGAISAGVGVATGAAYVGSIQAADREIWTALGTTTNLAARFQDLTRELDSDLVTDLATWRAAGEAAADLERREAVEIRGLPHREVVYLLPASR